MLESFPEKHIPHESSILLYKLNSSPKPLHKDPTLSTSMQGDSIPFDVPDGDNKNHIFAPLDHMRAGAKQQLKILESRKARL